MIKRKNGFLDLDSHFKNKDIKKFVKKSSYNDNHRWIIIGENLYYFKPAYFPTKELVASRLAKEVGFDTVLYDLALYNGKYGVISKSFKREGYKYVPMNKILNKFYQDNPGLNYEMGLKKDWESKTPTPSLKYMTNLMTFWQALEYYFGKEQQEDIKVIMDELVRRYFFYIIINNFDNLSRNFEIEISKTGIKLAPMYDNEFSFAPLAEVGLATDYSDKDLKFYESLMYFFTVSSSEYIPILEEIYNKIDLNMLENVINKVEKQIGVALPEEQKAAFKVRLNDARKVIRVALRENGVIIKKR